LKAHDRSKKEICARCGKALALTIDHFIPRCCAMSVNDDTNYVGLCTRCNREKGSRIVLPSWYIYLEKEQQDKLNRIMKYARSYVIGHTDDAEVLEYVLQL
jgi:hypothetical protein